MIALVEGAKRQKTPNEIALTILLAALTDRLPAGRRRLCSRSASLRGRHGLDHGAGRAARLPDPDDDRRAAVRHRHRRHGPARAAQRARDERPGGRGGRRRADAAARQDRHDHPRQPAGGGVPSRSAGTASRSWPRRRSSPRSPTRRPRAARSWSSRRSATDIRRARARQARRLRPVHRADPDDRPRHRRHGRSARARPRRSALGRRAGRHVLGRARPRSSSASRGTAARRWSVADGPQLLGVIDLKDIVKQGISERFAELRAMGIRTVMITGDNPLTAAAIAAGGRRRRLPGRGHARSQAGPDQGASRRAASSSR